MCVQHIDLVLLEPKKNTKKKQQIRSTHPETFPPQKKMANFSARFPPKAHCSSLLPTATFFSSSHTVKDTC